MYQAPSNPLHDFSQIHHDLVTKIFAKLADMKGSHQQRVTANEPSKCHKISYVVQKWCGIPNRLRITLLKTKDNLFWGLLNKTLTSRSWRLSTLSFKIPKHLPHK